MQCINILNFQYKGNECIKLFTSLILFNINLLGEVLLKPKSDEMDGNCGFDMSPSQRDMNKIII